MSLLHLFRDPKNSRHGALQGPHLERSSHRCFRWHGRPFRSPALIVTIAALGAATAQPAYAEEGRLAVNVTAAGSGAVLHGAVCALQRAGADSPYARFKAPAYSGKTPVRGGDVLHVYARGHDLAQVKLAEGQRSIKVVLQPASRQVVIKLEGVDKEDVRARLTLYVWSPGKWRNRPPIRESYKLSPASHGELRKGLTVSAPAGAELYLTAETDGMLCWPRMARVALLEGEPEGGRGAVTVHIDRAWRPTLRLPQGEGDPFVDVLPDMGRQPKVNGVPLHPRRADAWLWEVAVPWWGRGQRMIRDGERLTILPAIPFHIIVTTAKGTRVRYCEADGATTIDMRGKVGYRRVDPLPLVDGKVVDVGTHIVPGRLNLATLARFLDYADSHDRLCGKVGIDPLRRRPREIELPESEWLTVWHPEQGLAHLEWKPGQRPSGRRYSGTLRVEPPRGWRLSGEVAVYPVWRGTGSTRTTPPLGFLSREVRDPRGIEFPGLQPGFYCVRFQAFLQPEAGGRKRRIEEWVEKQVSAGPKRTIYVARRPR